VRCPSLEDLPSPPPGKTGWPWTEASRPLAERMPDGSVWPKISIVTSSYNYERYLETTIRSVLLQAYPNVEFIVQDDGSTDGSIALIKRYEKHLTHWVSAPNIGQPAVINRGLHRSTGSILACISSDDYYAPNAFGIAAQFFHDHPEVDLINGRCRIVDESGNKIGEHFGDITQLDEALDPWNFWWEGRGFLQPETFWRRQIWKEVGDFRTDLYIVFDYEYWCRMFLSGAVARSVDANFACFRQQPTQKTGNVRQMYDEHLDVIEKWLWDPGIPLTRERRRLLQGWWLFERRFQEAAGASLGWTQRTMLRRVQLLAIAIRYPQLWWDFAFRRKVQGIVTRWSRI
jgi:glycosyltransferase involved in cell wall biosynthesis